MKQIIILFLIWMLACTTIYAVDLIPGTPQQAPQPTTDIISAEHINPVTVNSTSRSPKVNRVDTLAPLINHLPLLNTPMIGTAQKVSATITDDLTNNNPLTATTLHYSLNNVSFTEVNLTTVGSNVYTAYIPNQPIGTQVWYYIRAVDSATNEALTTTYTFKFEDPTWLQHGGTSTYLGYTGNTIGALNVFTNPLYGSGYSMKLNSTRTRIRHAATANLYIYKTNNGSISQGGLIQVAGPIPVTLPATTTITTDLSAYNINIDTRYFCVSYQDVPPDNFWAVDTSKFYGISYVWRNGTLYNFSSYGTYNIGANIQTGSSLNPALNESFDSTTFPPSDWKTINQGDPNFWARGIDLPHTGTGYAVIDAPWPPTVDHNDWLITPKLRPTSANHTFTFWSRRWSDSIFENLNVKLSTTTNDVAGFTVNLATNLNPQTTYQQFTYDLTAYIGQDVYIGFQATSHQGWFLMIDDVSGIPFSPVYTVPNAATGFTPADLFTGVYMNPTLSWSLNGGSPTGVKLYLDTNPNPTTLYSLGAVNNYTPSLLLPNTIYYWKVVPTNGFGDATSVVNQFTTGPVLSYPASNATSSSYSDVGQFVLGAFSNPAEPPSPLTNNSNSNKTYTDFTNLGPIQLNRGNHYPISMTEITQGNGIDVCYLNVYIDYNRNGAYDLPGEVFFEGTTSDSNNPFTGTTNVIPADAMLGNTGLRVVLHEIDGYPILPTGTYIWGETEDYTVTISGAVPPVPVTLVYPADAATDVLKTSFNLTWSPALTGGNATSYTVYMSQNIATVLTDRSWTTTNLYFNPIIEGSLTVNYLETWYWTVKATNALGSATVTPAHSFRIMADPTVTLPYVQNFESTPYPVGWSEISTSGIAPNRWMCENLWGSGKLMITFGAEGNGITRLITPPVNTVGIPAIEVIFTNFISLYDAGLIAKLQYSHDLVTWYDTSWSIPEGGASYSDTHLVQISGLSSPQTYLAWTLDGNQANLEAWAVDDVYLHLPNGLVPKNVQVSNSGLITWDEVTGATYYNVYGSDTPNGPFTNLDIAVGTSWQAPFVLNKQFFHVTASTDILSKKMNTSDMESIIRFKRQEKK